MTFRHVHAIRAYSALRPLLLSAGVMIAASSSAIAQEASSPSGSVRPLGLRAGAFLLYPELEADAIVTDNVNQTKHGRKADIGERTSIGLRLNSNWSRHALSFSLTGQDIVWSRIGLDELTLSSTAALRLDVRRNLKTTLRAGYDLGHEKDSPKRLIHTLTGAVETEFGAGRLRPALTLGVMRVFYDDRGLEGRLRNPSDEDYIEPSAALRLEWDTGAMIRPYVETGGDMRLHDRSRDSSGNKRDTHGMYGEIGLVFDDAVWSGRIGLRGAIRHYEDDAYADIRGLGLNAALAWRPTRLTTVDFSAGFAIDETTTAGARAVKRSTANIRITHALRQNFEVGGNFGIEHDDYVGSALRETVLRTGLDASLSFYDGLALIAAWSLERQFSTEKGGDYLENRFTLGLRWKP